MTRETTRERKLTELVPDHVLRHEDRDMDLSIVDTECVSDKLGDDRRATRPCFDDSLLAGVVEDIDLVEEFRIDERSLLKTACHSNNEMGNKKCVQIIISRRKLFKNDEICVNIEYRSETYRSTMSKETEI